MSDNQSNNIGDSLKEYFKKKGLIQKDIAQRLGVTQATVSSLLNGKPFGKKLAKKWGDEFGIRPNWLITGEGEMLINENSGNNYGTIGSNNKTTITGDGNNNLVTQGNSSHYINVAMPESGYQKIIRPDGTTELIKSDSTLNENPNYINELKDQVRTLSSQVESLTILLEEKERLIKSKEETICILRNLHHKNQD